MNETLAGFLIIAVFIAALWLFFLVSRRLAAKGVGWMLRWPAAGLASFFTFLVVAALIGSQISSDEPQPDSPSQHEQTNGDDVATVNTAAIDKKAAAEVDSAVRPDGDKRTAPEIASSKEPKSHAESGPVIGVTLGDLTDSINANMRALDNPGTVRFDPVGSETKVVKATLNANAAVVAYLKPGSKQVTSLTVITAGDGTKASGLRAIEGVAATYAAMPGMALKKSGPLVMALIDKTKNDPDAHIDRNGLRYTLTQSNTIGNWFSIKPVD